MDEERSNCSTIASGNNKRPRVSEEKWESSSEEDNSSPEASPLPNDTENEVSGGRTGTNGFAFRGNSLPNIEKSTSNEIPPPPKIPRRSHLSPGHESHSSDESYIEDNPYAYGFDDFYERNWSSDSEIEEPINQAENCQQRGERVFAKYDLNYRRYNDVVKLAAYSLKDEIIDAITTNPVILIEGFSGCGKSTQVPQFILDRHVQAGVSCNIVVTQHSRIAAVSLARRVCKERGWNVGSVVGYEVELESKEDKNETMITYMTTNVLLVKLISGKSLKEWTHIIIDDVQKRDLDTDSLLLIIKKLLLDDKEGEERDAKIILMSATVIANKISKYYETPENDYADEEVPVVRIPYPANHGFAVEERFLDDLLRMGLKTQDELDNIYGNLSHRKPGIILDIYKVAVQIIVSLDNMERRELATEHDRCRNSAVMNDLYMETRGSVLVFLPGLLEIETLFKLLTEENRRHMSSNGGDPDNHKWTIVPLLSSSTTDEQSRVFESVENERRKIILSTNISENSITIPDVIYVVDFCLTKSRNIDPTTNFSCHRMDWASINQCIQRKGRTGRVGDGHVYRLVPKRFFAELAEHTEPEMLKSSLELVVLRVKKLDIGTPKDILDLAIDPPLISGIERAVVTLKEVGALTLMAKRENQLVYDKSDGDITFMGIVMSALPISLQLARLIMLGHVFGVMKECIIIAAGLSVKSPFSKPFQNHLEPYLSKLSWAEKTHSDCFAILKVYRYWSTNFADSSDGRNPLRGEQIWARGAFVQVSIMREIRSLVEELENQIKAAGIIPCPLSSDTFDDGVSLSKEQALMIKVAIAGAFYPNYFHRHRPDLKSFEKERSREVDTFDLFNTVYFKGFPTGHNGKLYAKHIADRLSIGLDVPTIKFEGSKVLAVFDKKGEKIGPVNRGVYRAVKMRQLREQPIQFNVLSKKKEIDYLHRPERRLPFRRCPPQAELPGIDVKMVYVRVTHVENPSQFWVIYEQHKAKQDWIVNVINSNPCRLPLPRDEISPGTFCLAPFEEECGHMTYHRAKIISVNPVGEAFVYFADYGNSYWVNSSHLASFSQIHLQSEIHLIPCLAVECRLSELTPAIAYGSVWDVEAITNFRISISEASFVQLKIYAVVKSVIVGQIIGEKFQGEIMNVNHKLLHDGFADFAHESYMCSENHRARLCYEFMRRERDTQQIQLHNKKQIADGVEQTLLEPPMDDANIRVELKGCWSPLELEFQSLCHGIKSKQVLIHADSVNSVALDHEPTACTSRMLVSANIGIQDKGGHVIARDTTMMPAIPDLLALMSMLFAPKIELRTDSERFCYTGVLCGLGTVPDSQTESTAIYPDHDVEVIFDTKIDDEDIFFVNRIRYYMNLILRDSGGRNMALIHNDIVEEMFRLLTAPRKRVDEELELQEPYAWNRIKPEFIKPPQANTFPTEPSDIFLPHNTITLEDLSEI